MATITGNVLGNLSGRLGNLSARTINGRTVLAARPSSYSASQEAQSVEVRQKFAVTATFAKFVLALSVLAEIWKSAKEEGLTLFNTIFRYNFAASSTTNPTVDNIIAPANGFPLQITTAAVDTNKITATIPALNASAVFSVNEVAASANALVVYHDPVNPEDPEFQILALSKEVAAFNFGESYNLQIDYNVNQVGLAAKYSKNILYLAVASKDAAGKIVQHSYTYSKASA